MKASLPAGAALSVVVADTPRIPGGEWPPRILLSGRADTSEEQGKTRFLELRKGNGRALLEVAQTGAGRSPLGPPPAEILTDLEVKQSLNRLAHPDKCKTGVDRDSLGINSKELET